MRIGTVALIALLLIALGSTTAAVVRLENYRYANFLGACKEYGVADERCPVGAVRLEQLSTVRVT